MTYRDIADPNEKVGIATRGDRKVYHRLNQDLEPVCNKLPEIVNLRRNRRKNLQQHYTCCSYCHPAIRTVVDKDKQPDHKLCNKLKDPNMTDLPGLSD